MRENAADLFPRKIRRENRTVEGMLQQNFRTRATMRNKTPPSVAWSLLEEDEIDSESLPAEIEGLAQDTIHCMFFSPALPVVADAISSRQLLERVPRILRRGRERVDDSVSA